MDYLLGLRKFVGHAPLLMVGAVFLTLAYLNRIA